MCLARTYNNPVPESLSAAAGGLIIGLVAGLTMLIILKNLPKEVRAPFTLPLSTYAWAVLAVYIIAATRAGAVGTVGHTNARDGESISEPIRPVSDGERWRAFSHFVDNNLLSALAGVGVMHYLAKRRRARTK